MSGTVILRRGNHQQVLPRRCCGGLYQRQVAYQVDQKEPGTTDTETWLYDDLRLIETVLTGKADVFIERVCDEARVAVLGFAA